MQLIRTAMRGAGPLALAAVLAGCSSLSLPGGVDLVNNPPSTTQIRPAADRPEPDARGVITYPNYQVAVAERGDTVADVAARLGLDAAALAERNGLPGDADLRAGELLVLPRRVEPAGPGTGTQGEGEIDVATLAGTALDRAEGTAPEAAPAEQTNTAPAGPEPGQGSPTPLPPSAAAPQPEEDLPPAAEAREKAAQEPEEPPETAPRTEASDTARLLQPVGGRIIRAFDPPDMMGVDFSAEAGAPVRAAAAGRVATITSDPEQVPIVVLRHDDGLLTVYANLADIAVEEGAQVGRGETLGAVAAGDPAFLHFEVCEGFDCVDPVPYLTE